MVEIHTISEAYTEVNTEQCIVTRWLYDVAELFE